MVQYAASRIISSFDPVCVESKHSDESCRHREPVKNLFSHLHTFVSLIPNQTAQQIWKTSPTVSMDSWYKPHLLQGCREELFIKNRNEAISSYGGNPANLREQRTAHHSLKTGQSNALHKLSAIPVTFQSASQCLCIRQQSSQRLSEEKKLMKVLLDQSQHTKLLLFRRAEGKFSCFSSLWGEIMRWGGILYRYNSCNVLWLKNVFHCVPPSNTTLQYNAPGVWIHCAWKQGGWQLTQAWTQETEHCEREFTFLCVKRLPVSPPFLCFSKRFQDLGHVFKS